jgi:hypothetical protein
MQGIVSKLETHPWVIALLAVAFIFSMVGFWQRIRRDERKRTDKKFNDH